MVSFKNLATLVLSASLAVASPVTEVTQRSANFKNLAYFTNWGIYGRNYQPAQLPVSKLNQVLYSFANFRADGTVYSSDTYADLEKHYEGDSWNDVGTNAYGCVKQLYKLKKTNRQLKVLLSIGGWTYSSGFSAAASTAATRANFAKTAVALIGDWGFDGIDIDWEWPATETDANNMVSLMQALRAELDAYASRNAPGYRFLLTACLPAGPENYNKMKLGALNSVVDQFNMLSYDYTGSWDTRSGHQANVYASSNNPSATPFSTDAALTAYRNAGVSFNKLTLGLPLYGRAFENTAGLGQSFSGVGSGTWEAGIYDYKVLPLAGATEQYDSTAVASYSFDSAKKQLISYDNVAAVKAKAAYLQSKGLAGTMFWEASGDRTDGGSLISAAFDAQGGAGSLDRAQNLLSYPASKYANIKNNLA